MAESPCKQLSVPADNGVVRYRLILQNLRRVQNVKEV